MRVQCLSFALIAVLGVACGDDDGGTTVDAPPAALSCSTYCTTLMGACTGANQQFTDMAQCVASCGAYPVGTAADMSGNTLGCRTYHAGAAKTGADVHCVHAGPGGAGMCGTNIEGLCQIVQKACTGADGPTKNPFASAADCASKLAAVVDTTKYNVMQTGGDTLACRLYHATVASVTPDPHCQHPVAVSATCKAPAP